MATRAAPPSRIRPFTVELFRVLGPKWAQNPKQLDSERPGRAKVGPWAQAPQRSFSVDGSQARLPHQVGPVVDEIAHIGQSLTAGACRKYCMLLT